MNACTPNILCFVNDLPVNRQRLSSSSSWLRWHFGMPVVFVGCFFFLLHREALLLSPPGAFGCFYLGLFGSTRAFAGARGACPAWLFGSADSEMERRVTKVTKGTRITHEEERGVCAPPDSALPLCACLYSRKSTFSPSY